MKPWMAGTLAALAVAGLGLTVGWLAEAEILPNPLITASYEMDLAGLATRAGLLLGVLVLAGILAALGLRRLVERRQAAALEGQVSARQRFFQRLDHELKNPLTIIRLGLVNLQQSPSLSAEQSGSLERISQQAQRLQKLVVDLRLLYELDKTRIERKPVALRELLEEAVTLADPLGEPARRIVLHEQKMPWPVSDVRGDRDLLLVVFRNLMDNALKFSPPQGQVEVRLGEDGRMAIVDVVDAGPGIPAQEIPHIFEELYRGENARGVPGSGLGLRLVERIVQLHDGAVQVRSKPEHGSVFTVRLPLAGDGGEVERKQVNK
jgi:two-component system OmpR family sensor kinase